VSVDDDERSGQPSTSKTTENVEKIWELIHEDRLLNNPWACRHCWDQLWSLPDLNRKSEYAPHCSIMTMRPPTRPWKLTTTWLSFPILPTRRT
jgi:hypothetical protein